MKSFSIHIIILFIMISVSAQNYPGLKDAQGLQVGQHAPDFYQKDAEGKDFKLSDALKKGPVVIIFYRGQWCPVCNKHLSQVQENLEQIMEKGSMVVAISPEKPEYLEKTALKTGANFSLIYDEGYKIADAYDVTFRPDSLTRMMYNTILKANLKEAHSDESERLPIPATYIVEPGGKIVWRHFDPDYKKRSTIEDIISNLDSPDSNMQ